MKHACPVGFRAPFASFYISSNATKTRACHFQSLARATLSLRLCHQAESSRISSHHPSLLSSRSFSSTSISQARKRWIKTGGIPSQPAEHQAQRTWQDYDPEIGIPLESGELDQATISSIFGPGVDEIQVNHVLRLMNYRRISGSLIDVGAIFAPETGISQQIATKALSYLRDQDPNFNEQDAGAAWAEAEVNRVEQEYMARAEKLGIYQKTSSERAEESSESPDVYGESALAALRRENKARWMEADRKKKELKELERMKKVTQSRGAGVEPASRQEQQAREESDEASPTAVSLNQPMGKAWLQPVERKSWVKYYEEQATIVKDNKVPQMSTLRRLGPSALLALGVIGGCIALHEMYAPPPKSARIFPDIPPAIATLGAITALNLGTFVAWRMPFLWRTMNKYFVVAPGYPFAAGIFGAQFGHQAFTHFLYNTVLLWPFGLMLHEDVGRGTFLAIYLGCGTMGALGSLVFNVLQKRWLYYIFGSSTAVYGTIAATCLIRANHDVKFAGYEVPLTGMTLLGVFGGLQILAAWKGKAMNVDYSGHLTGMATGIAAAYYLHRQAAQREMTEQAYVPDEPVGGV